MTDPGKPEAGEVIGPVTFERDGYRFRLERKVWGSTCWLSEGNATAADLAAAGFVPASSLTAASLLASELRERAERAEEKLATVTEDRRIQRVRAADTEIALSECQSRLASERAGRERAETELDARRRWDTRDGQCGYLIRDGQTTVGACQREVLHDGEHQRRQPAPPSEAPEPVRDGPFCAMCPSEKRAPFPCPEHPQAGPGYIDRAPTPAPPSEAQGGKGEAELLLKLEQLIREMPTLDRPLAMDVILHELAKMRRPAATKPKDYCLDCRSTDALVRYMGCDNPWHQPTPTGEDPRQAADRGAEHYGVREFDAPVATAAEGELPQWCECEEYGQYVALPCAPGTCPTVRHRVAAGKAKADGPPPATAVEGDKPCHCWPYNSQGGWEHDSRCPSSPGYAEPPPASPPASDADGETKCQCGHGRIWHVGPRGVGLGSGPACHCGCDCFTLPASPPPASLGPVELMIAALRKVSTCKSVDYGDWLVKEALRGVADELARMLPPPPKVEPK